MNDRIKCYFEQFGEVDTVEIHQENYGFVEFKMIETAATVLSDGIHHIDGCAVQVKVAESDHQPDHILNVPDNDCLRKILSDLNSLDLTRATSACDRFNELAKSIFSADKFKKLDHTKCDNTEAKSSLNFFGSLSQSIDIRGAVDGDTILSMIDKYCTTMLKELTLTSFRFKKVRQFRYGPRSFHEDTVRFHASLERICLNRCLLSKSSGNLLANCDELKLLNLQKCSLDAGTYVRKFEKLEELRLIEIKGFNDDLLNRLIALNQTLTKLALLT